MATSASQRRSQNRGALAEHKGNGKPAAFDLDAYQAEAVREPFTFTLGGKTFALPHVQDLDWHIAIGASGEVATPTVHELIRGALGSQWGEFNKLKLTAGGYNELWKRWQEHSGIELGESAASPAS